MSRTLTTDQENARAADGHTVSRFISLGAYRDLALTYYSERDPDKVFSPDSGETFIPLLTGFQHRDRRANLALEELPLIQRFEFSILNSDEFETPIGEQVDDVSGGFIGREIVAYEVLRPIPGASAPTSADWMEIFRGEIESVALIDNKQVSFMAVDFMKRPGEEIANRAITLALFPDCPEINLGGMMPIIFGPVDAAPGIQVTEGAFSTLDAELLANETARMDVVDASVFTDTGSVQVGNEQIAYTGRDLDDGIGEDGTDQKLTGLTRGIGATDLSFGQRVTQLETIRFLMADQDLTHNDDVDFAAAGEVTDANGSAYNEAFYEKATEIIDGRLVTFIDVEQEGFPSIAETQSSTTKKDLAEDLGDDSLVEDDWAIGALSEGVFSGNAVDSNEDTKHVTSAEVGQGNTFHHRFRSSTNLSDQVGVIKKAKAFIEYAVIPSRGQPWPVSPNQIKVSVMDGDTTGNLVGAVHDLGEPAEREGDTKLFPESDSAAPTTDLFQYEGDSIGVGSSVDTRFRSFSGSLRQTWTKFPEDPVFNDSWDQIKFFSDGDIINYSTTNVRSTLVTGSVGLDNLVGDNVVHVADLNLRLFDDGFWPSATTEIRATINVIGFDSLGGVKGSARARFFISSHSFASPLIEVTGLDHNTAKDIVISLAASDVDVESFSASDLATVSIQIAARNQTLTPGPDGSEIVTAANKILYRVLSVEARLISGTALVGSTDPIDSTSIVPSQRVRQEIDISDEVDSWDFFVGDPSPPGIRIQFPAQSNDFLLKIYNIGFLVEVLETITRATRVEEYTLRADSIGYSGNSDATQASSTLSSELAIKTLLGTIDDRFYNLRGARINSASLISALNTVAAELTSSSRNDWLFSRRLVSEATNRQLLGQILTDAGIRAVIEGGQIVFFPSISPLPADSIRTIDDNKTSSPVRRPTTITLVTNSLTLRFQESLTSPGKFENEILATDAISITEIQTRASVYSTFFIRDSAVAQALANLLLDDFSFARALVNMSVARGPNIDLQVGDTIGIADTPTRFTGQVGRIIDIRMGDDVASQMALRLALTNKRLVIWQWEDEDDPEYSKIEVNQWTKTLFFTVDTVLVARLDGEGLKIRGGMEDTLLAASVQNDVNTPDETIVALARSGSGDTGLVEYIPKPGGFSNGFIGIGVYDGATEEYYRVATLGYNTATGPQQFDSLAINDYEDDGAFPVVQAGFPGTDHIDTDSTGVAVDGDFLASGDLLRVYMQFEKFIDSGAINGRLIVRGIETDVDL